MSHTAAEQEARVAAILAEWQERPGALLPILHAVQGALGYVPNDVIPMIARALNLSRAEVYGVVTFYHYFRQTRPGKRQISVCRAEACQARGAAGVENAIKAALGIDYQETTADG